MIIILAFLVCTAPDRCRLIELYGRGSLQLCLVQAQAVVAKWESENPGWQHSGPMHCKSGVPT